MPRPSARRSGSASATASASAWLVSRIGPIHVAVSRMYSTCSSEWRVPLMKVTDASIGQEPCAPTISHAPRPFCTVITVAAGK